MRLTRNDEDYLEMIFLLGKMKKAVRVKDLAREFGVTMPSVVSAVRSLADKGLVDHEKYGYLELTEKGEKKAEEIYKKHYLLFRFFHEVLGIDRETSHKDACKVEHFLSRESLEAISGFVKELDGQRKPSQRRK